MAGSGMVSSFLASSSKKSKIAIFGSQGTYVSFGSSFGFSTFPVRENYSTIVIAPVLLAALLLLPAPASSYYYCTLQ